MSITQRGIGLEPHMARTKRAPTKVWALEVDPRLPAPAQAASLALVILAKTKTSSWDELESGLLTGDEATRSAMELIDLTEDQYQVLVSHPLAVRLVSPAPPVRSVAICGECDEFFALAGNPPSGCAMTMGCEGKPAKVRAAAATKVSVDDLAGQDQDEADVAAQPEEVQGELDIGEVTESGLASPPWDDGAGDEQYSDDVDPNDLDDFDFG